MQKPTEFAAIRQSAVCGYLAGALIVPEARHNFALLAHRVAGGGDDSGF
jgi:hypothetical protein